MLPRIATIALTVLLLVGCDAQPDGEPNNAPSSPASRVDSTDEPNDATPPDHSSLDANDRDQPGDAVDPNQTAATQPTWEEGQFEAALEQVLALEEKARFSQAIRRCFAMQQRFSGHPRVNELTAILARLRDHRQLGANVPFALEQLTSEVPTKRLTAARTIRDAGDTGLIFLRRTMRNDTGELAVQAARWLGEWQDPNALPLFVDRLQDDPSDPMHAVVTKALAEWPEPLPSEILADLLKLVRKDESFRQIRLAVALARAVSRQAEGDPNAFNELVGSDRAFADLQTYMKRAAKSGNEVASALAARYAGALELYRKGLLGEYYHGDSFDKRVMTRIDKTLRFPDGDGKQFRYPQGRQTEISIRWRGWLAVPKDGTYTFYASSDDGKRVWIDGKKVLDDWVDQGMDDEQFQVKLSAGLVPIRIEYYQGDGGAGIVLRWTGPGMDEKQILGPEFLRARMAPDAAGNAAAR